MSEFSDYIIYVDESGDPNLSNINPVFPLFCLSFCIISKTEYSASVVPSFQRFKFKYFGLFMNPELKPLRSEREIIRD